MKQSKRLMKNPMKKLPLSENGRSHRFTKRLMRAYKNGGDTNSLMKRHERIK